MRRETGNGIPHTCQSPEPCSQPVHPPFCSEVSGSPKRAKRVWFGLRDHEPQAPAWFSIQRGKSLLALGRLAFPVGCLGNSPVPGKMTQALLSVTHISERREEEDGRAQAFVAVCGGGVWALALGHTQTGRCWPQQNSAHVTDGETESWTILQLVPGHLPDPGCVWPAVFCHGVEIRHPRTEAQ